MSFEFKQLDPHVRDPFAMPTSIEECENEAQLDEYFCNTRLALFEARHNGDEAAKDQLTTDLQTTARLMKEKLGWSNSELRNYLEAKDDLNTRRHFYGQSPTSRRDWVNMRDVVQINDEDQSTKFNINLPSSFRFPRKTLLKSLFGNRRKQLDQESAVVATEPETEAEIETKPEVKTTMNLLNMALVEKLMQDDNPAPVEKVERKRRIQLAIAVGATSVAAITALVVINSASGGEASAQSHAKNAQNSSHNHQLAILPGSLLPMPNSLPSPTVTKPETLPTTITPTRPAKVTPEKPVTEQPLHHKPVEVSYVRQFLRHKGTSITQSLKQLPLRGDLETTVAKVLSVNHITYAQARHLAVNASFKVPKHLLRYGYSGKHRR